MSAIVLILGLVFTASAFANPMLPQKSLMLDLSQSDLDPTELSASLEVRCTYKQGWFFPETESCGNSTVQASVTQDAQILIPAIEAFDHPEGGRLKNYQISLNVNREGTQVFQITAYGKDGLQSWKNWSQTLFVNRLPGGPINVQYQGQDFFGTSWTQLDQAILSIQISSEITEPRSDFFIMHLIHWSNLGGDNRNYTSSEDQLRNLTEIILPDTYFVSTQPLDGQKLLVSAVYESRPGANKTELGFYTSVPVSLSEGAAAIPIIELEP